MKLTGMYLLKPAIVALILLTFLPSTYAVAVQDSAIDFADNAVDPEILQIQEESRGHFKNAFSNLDYDEYLQTARILEVLLRDHGTDIFVKDAYFILADIYYARLQDETYCRDAIRVLESFLETFPYRDECLDARMTISFIYYRYLNELDSAVEVLNQYFDTLSYYSYLESELLQAQLLLARCYQKQGKFGREKKIWDGLIHTNPDADSYGRYRFLNDIENWKRLSVEGIVVYFQAGIPEGDYQAILSAAERELSELESIFSNTLPYAVELYLYTDTDTLAQYTHFDESFSVDNAGEIHMHAAGRDEMPQLMTNVYSSALNMRARDVRHPLMKGGLDYFRYVDPSGNDIDSLAARHLSIFDDTPSASLLLRESAFYGSAEYDKLAGSFCAYLIENKPVKDFITLYNGLYPRHTPEQIEAIFELFYGRSMDDLVAEWYDALSPRIAEARLDRSISSYDRTPVELDLSTPEATLGSWYEALRMGDYDALIGASTPDLAELLKKAREVYEEEGIFDEVLIEEFVFPYYPTTYRVTSEGPIGDELYIFKIEIVKDGEVIEEKNVALTRIKKKWYVGTNL